MLGKFVFSITSAGIPSAMIKIAFCANPIFMKKISTKIIVILFSITFVISNQLMAQAPEKMSYQAVVRNSSNSLVVSSLVGMKISILQGTASGTPVHVETQTPTTNSNGLVSIEIGAGTVVSGSFLTIDWSNGPYFVKTEIDPNGGTSYSILGTSQLLSVPYALYSKLGGFNVVKLVLLSFFVLNASAS